MQIVQERPLTRKQQVRALSARPSAQGQMQIQIHLQTSIGFLHLKMQGMQGMQVIVWIML
jgi:hypothetical protein